VGQDNRLKRHARKAGVFWGVSLKATQKHPLGQANKQFNRKMSSIRAMGAVVGGAERRQAGLQHGAVAPSSRKCSLTCKHSIFRCNNKGGALDSIAP
jgi:hypothetical protein